MLKKLLCLLITTFVVSSCTTPKKPFEYTALAVKQNEMNTEKWRHLQRYFANYPVNGVSDLVNGCATIEYVITPDNEIKDLRVVTATRKNFAEAAKYAVTKWEWADLPKNIISQPVKTQTRFEFCIGKPNKPCAEEIPVHACPGEDTLYSTGFVIQH